MPNGPSSVQVSRTLRPRMLGNKAGGLEQVDADPDPAVAVVAKVDRAARDRPERRRAERYPAVEDPVLQRRAAADPDHRARSGA